MKRYVFFAAAAVIFASCATTKKAMPVDKTLTAEEQDNALFEMLKLCVDNSDSLMFAEYIDDTAPARIRRIINRTTADGKTLLHKAVLLESAAIVKRLLAAGADKNFRDQSGNTPTDYAKTARTKTIRELFGFREKSEKVKQEKSVEKPEPSIQPETVSVSQTGYSYDVVLGQADSEFLKNVKNQDYAAVNKMLKNGQNVNTSDMRGNNALFYALKDSNGGIINLLLSYNINCNYRNKSGQLPFLYAVDKGNIAIITDLLSAGANINQTDVSGLNAVMIAVFRRNAALLKFLHSKNASLTGRDSQGNTLLHIAIKNEDLASTRYLLEQGVDAYDPNDNGVKPIDLLRTSKRMELRSMAKDYE